MKTGDKPGGGANAERRHTVDVHVGNRLRQRRMLLGLSQESLATSVGLTFQQIQKYERGANRIGAGRLYDLSHCLEVPLGYFFEGLRDAAGTVSGRRGPRSLDPTTHHRENADLIRCYHRIGDPRMRACLLELCRAMAAAPHGSRSAGGVLLT